MRVCAQIHRVISDFPALGERFSITREIGRGGAAVVYQAQDRVLDREVAIKLLTAETSAALGRDRFEQEIRLTSRLVHPNIVPLFDSGAFDEQMFYVMPFIDGDTLRSRLKREGLFSADERTAIAIDIAEALAYSHGMGLVHRDIKPENIFFYHGRAMLADFGIAKRADLTQAGSLTATGTFVGTLAYISPEQAQSCETVDGRADLYSLGCVLFELLTGDPPYAGPTMMAFLSQHMAAPVPHLRWKCSNCCEREREVPNRCLRQSSRECRTTIPGSTTRDSTLIP